MLLCPGAGAAAGGGAVPHGDAHAEERPRMPRNAAITPDNERSTSARQSTPSAAGASAAACPAARPPVGALVEDVERGGMDGAVSQGATAGLDGEKVGAW